MMNRQGRSDEPIKLMQEAVQADPDDARLRLLLGEVSASAGQAEEAVEQVRKALELQPGMLRRALRPGTHPACSRRRAREHRPHGEMFWR